jgi:GYD domain
LSPKSLSAILGGRGRQSALLYVGVVTVAKYLVLFSLTGETIKRFLDRPSDRAAVVRDLADSVRGSLESYYWMFGQYDGSARGRAIGCQPGGWLTLPAPTVRLPARMEGPGC